MQRNFTQASLKAILMVFILMVGVKGWGQVAAWDFSGLSNYGPSPYAATVSDPDVTVIGLTRGPGLTTTGSAGGNSWGSAGYEVVNNAAAAIANNDFVFFQITADAGFSLSLSSISPYNIRRSSSGPTTGIWQYQVGAGSFIDIGGPITWGTNTAGAGNLQASIDLSGISDLQNVAAGTAITFRVINYNSTGTGGTWYFNNFQTGNDLIVNGTVTAGTTTPSKLAITSISPSSPTANAPFDVTVQAQDGSNVPATVTANTDITLSVATGTGTLGGTLTGTILAGTNSVVISGVTYSVAENGVVLTATRTAGDVLTAGNSEPFNVLAQASQLAFVGVPPSGFATTDLATFTVEARRPDNTVDNTYTGNISITKATGPGNISGTTTRPAVNGIATFDDIQFDQPGTYTITATSGTLTSATSGDITIAAAPVLVMPGQVLINQISPDYGANASDEYVELVNTTGSPIDLSELKLVYYASSGGQGGAGGALTGIIPAHGFWLLLRVDSTTITAGKNAGLSRDGIISTGFAAGAGQISLQRVFDNVQIDGVAYGSVTNVIGEGSSASAPPTDGGLRRATDGVDTDNNNTDFVAVTNANIYLRNSMSRLANPGAIIDAGTYTDLVVTGNSSLAGLVNVTNLVDVQAGTLTTGDNLTLRSTATKTARVGQIISGSISGKVTVERYIPAAGNRAWRLLAAPLANDVNAPFIFNSWQESGNATAGYGTHITQAGGAGTNGFDASTIAGASSIRYFDGTALQTPATTNATKVTNHGAAWFLFVRGDRTIDINNSSASSNTTLRMAGTINQGNVTAGIAGASTSLIPNPYPSPVDYEAVFNANTLTGTYYVWDAELGTVGAYRTIERTAAQMYQSTPTTGNDNLMRYIRSGQAIFVPSNTTVNFTEAMKTEMTPSINVFRTGAGVEELMINLNVVNGANVVLTDGVRAKYSNGYSNNVDGNDIVKMNNFTENLAIVRSNQALAVEKRDLVDNADTIFLKLWNTGLKNYQFNITPADFSTTANLEAFLLDSYTQSSTLVGLSGNTTYDFSVTPDAASAAQDRFMIVFKSSTALPVSYTTVKAFQKDAGIQVEWKVATEGNIVQYEVERSLNGNTFTKAGVVAARANSGAVVNYTWLDAMPLNGTNYYRIKALDNTGALRYSNVVNVKIGGIKRNISIYPNPVKGHTISLQLDNIEAGAYQVTVFNNLGQQVMNRILNHAGGSATQTIQLDNGIGKGVYQLQVTDGNTTLNHQLVVQ